MGHLVMPARKPRPDEKPQIQDFIETARKLGSDESREAFERAFAKVTDTHPPKGTVPTKVSKNRP
jgi:hypothetical protein